MKQARRFCDASSILADVHFDELTEPEQRVLGCLIEKRWTTPDLYPLSLNALRLACNQSTARDPVTHYDEATVRDAAQRLARYGLTRLASGHQSRAAKYRHLAEEGLGLDREQLALLAVMLLRGVQTPGELKGRAERLARFESLADVERVLAQLIERDYARRIDRRPGQKEDRFEQLLGGAGTSAGVTAGAPESVPAAGSAPAPAAGSAPEPALAPASAPGSAPAPVSPPTSTAAAGPSRDEDLVVRVAALEQEVQRLRATLNELLS